MHKRPNAEALLNLLDRGAADARNVKVFGERLREVRLKRKLTQA